MNANLLLPTHKGILKPYSEANQIWLNEIEAQCTEFNRTYAPKLVDKEIDEMLVAIAASERFNTIPPNERTNVLYMHLEVRKLLLKITAQPKRLIVRYVN